MITINCEGSGYRKSKSEDPYREIIKSLGKQVLNKFLFEPASSDTLDKIRKSFIDIFKTDDLLRKSRVVEHVSVEYRHAEDKLLVEVKYCLVHGSPFSVRYVRFSVTPSIE